MNTDYPVLPHIAYGKIDQNKGFFYTIPFRGISINTYRKLHHGAIKKHREQYKAIFDVVNIASFKKNYFNQFDENGAHLSKPLFTEPIEVEWYLNFLNTQDVHDVGNYTQKIVLDAIVDTGILKDDSEEYVVKESVRFGVKGFDSITCFMKGKIQNQMLLKVIKNTTYKALLKSVGVKL